MRRGCMKSFKPKDGEAISEYIPKNVDELFLDLKLFELYRSAARTMLDKYRYLALALRLGDNVFVFDIDSCEFFEEGE
jgi:hypothetical protein